jgi:hypothetical protein
VPNKISEQDRVTVKQHIVDLMLSMPTKLQRQLSEAVCQVAQEALSTSCRAFVCGVLSYFIPCGIFESRGYDKRPAGACLIVVVREKKKIDYW